MVGTWGGDGGLDSTPLWRCGGATGKFEKQECLSNDLQFEQSLQVERID